MSWPALNQIVCALRFFYGVTLGHDAVPERIAYAREPRKLPVVLSADEVVRFLEAIPSLKSRTALTTVYAAGLRVSEVIFLKVTDIDSQRMVIRVEQGKGGKDRYVMLSPQLLRILRSYWRFARPRLFRRLFLQKLRDAFDAGKLRFFGNLAGLAEPTAFTTGLNQLRRIDWVVYAKPPFGGPGQVLAYLSRYTHRVAITNSRLISLSDGKVRFTWKDYSTANPR
jgi:integrase